MRRLSRRRSARYDAGEYLIDGPTLLGDALDSGVALRRVYAEPEALGSSVVQRAALTAELWPVADGALAKVLDVVTPNGMVAVAGMGLATVEELLQTAGANGGFLLVLVDVADPGNVGTLVRATEAAGGCGVVMAGTTTDPFSPKTVRASAGSVFRLPVVVEEDPGLVLESITQAGLRSWATVVNGGVHPETASLREASTVVIGNESHGLSEEIVARCSDLVSIPMSGTVESLNAAMAGTVVLFEAARQRRSGDVHPNT